MALHQRCTQADVSARPLFADVARMLSSYMEVASNTS
jgi:hypothetical protein